ncbi:flagellar hook-length control protein FliK [Achromobacter xylosoxidans]
MSVGPAALGNVLVQRLDAVLGTTMSAASANQVSGARPDAVSQPGSLEKPGQADGSPRDPRQGVQTGGARGERAAIVDAKTAAALALAARGLVTSNDTTASAPTTLGRTARAILSLLAQYPDAAPPVQGRAPLWTPDASAFTASPVPLPGSPPRASRRPAASPGSARQYARRTTAGRCREQRRQRGDGPERDRRRPGNRRRQDARPDRRHRGRAPAQAPTPPPAPRWPRRVRSPARWARPCAKPCRPAACSTNHTWPIWPSTAPTHPSCAKNRRPTSSRPTPSSSNTAPPPRAHAPKRPPAVAPAARTPASGGSNAPAPGTPINGIHQDLNALVRQQLDVLANRALAWRGEAWPGTPMDWEVQRDPYGGDPESAVPTWATRLKLDLPRLGLVDARLNLAGDQIVLQLVAPHSAALIDESSDQLRSRLLAAGLTLSHMTVNVVDPRPIIPTDF